MRLFRIDDRPAYGLTQAFTSGKDYAYTALLVATKAAAAMVDRFGDERAPKNGRPAPATIAFPIVVVDQPLFRCWLDDANEVTVEECDCLTLSWLKPYPTAQFAWPHTLVHVVTRGFVREFAGEVADECRALLNEFGAPDLGSA